MMKSNSIGFGGNESVSASRKFEIGEENKKMSFTCILYTPEATYIAADSRIVTQNSNGSFDVRTDNYEKIISVPNTPYFVVATGLADFDEKSLRDIVKSTPYNDKKEIMSYLFQQFIKYEIATNTRVLFYLVGYENNKKVLASNSDNEKIFLNPCCDYIIYSTGIDEGTQRITKYDEFSIRNQVKNNAEEDFINELFSEIIKNDKTKTVGGPIRILKLTPEGHEWLQNGPENE